VVGEPDEDGEVAGEVVEVHVVADRRREFPIRCARHEPAKSDDALFLRVRQIGLRIVGLVVGRPVRSPIGEQVLRRWLEDRSLLRAEPLLEEVLVDVLGD
jgi:hypothetical protein